MSLLTETEYKNMRLLFVALQYGDDSEYAIICHGLIDLLDRLHKESEKVSRVYPATYSMLCQFYLIVSEASFEDRYARLQREFAQMRDTMQGNIQTNFARLVETEFVFE